ncbi:hypothetical protein CYMTET_35979 [Cymbomonas tetramitiformis]|uniref:Uncharacterized protein n=1 Tax=Cymbomonas tetramitiformis TaxID=36881 RepID=A0AAE0F852_9CHLO|nr:hypothetical protein CYMTET_35979 [Cymbomonas tetramitiformis]
MPKVWWDPKQSTYHLIRFSGFRETPQLAASGRDRNDSTLSLGSSIDKRAVTSCTFPVLTYVAASASDEHLVGKFLPRGQGVSYRCVDTTRSVMVTDVNKVHLLPRAPPGMTFLAAKACSSPLPKRSVPGCGMDALTERCVNLPRQ